MFRPLSACLAVLVLMGVMPVQAQQTAYTGLVCRGVEESGRLIIGQPGFGPHLISIFATGPNPLSASQTITQHVAWVTDPLHSYVPDGFGAMCIWAHPDGQKPETLLALPGLSGFELNYAGWGARYDALADGVWRACVAAQRPFLWGYAADDTHASGAKGLSWFAARLPERTEKALKHALRTGAFYVSNGPTIANITGTNDSLTIALDQPGDVCWLRDGQFLAADKDEPIPVQVAAEAGTNRCLQMDRGVTTSTLTLGKLPVPRAQLQFVRAVVGMQPTKMAQTQPFRLLPDGQIANPYPAAGAWVRGQTHNHSDTPPWSNVGLQRFRLGYQEKGEAASFCTDYSYWESPYQWAPEDGTPQVLAVQPSRLAAGASQPVTITGLNFGEAPRVQFGAQAAQVLEHAPNRLRVALPGGLAPGAYDVVVDNERFRGALTLGFAVQKPDADTRGWTSVTSADGLCYDRCVAIACRGSEVWVGTMNGLGMLRDGQWRTVTTEMGARSVYAMAADPDGSVWVATERGLAHCDVTGAWKAETVGQVEKVDKNRATERWGRMLFDGQGALWTINRWSAGLGVRRDGQWQRLTAAADGIPTNAPNTIARDKSGTVWLGYGGLARLVNGTWEKLAIPAEAGGTTVAALAPLADGAMLAAINSDPDKGALVVFRDGKGEVMPLSQTRLPSPRVRDALAARSGDIWIATDYGVTRWDGRGQWRHYDTLNSGLGCNIVLGLAEDDQGRIWMATARGVSSFAP
ncbi:IPT/TIG domain-containing protein [bacterium]|nr:IPT/TIG domain-containing protein [bacterium]